MNKAPLIRKSFNGGELSPYLHFRDTLDAYHDGLKELKNMQVTPWGAVDKRVPSKLIVQLDSMYGTALRYFPFKFSQTETFHIVFFNDSSVVKVRIFDATGSIQLLQTGITVMDTPYGVSDVQDIEYIQVNDFIYMAHGDHPVQLINRYYDDTAATNLWKVEEYDISFPPFDAVNEDGDHTLSLNVAEYDSGTTYAKGDVVIGSIADSADIPITRVQWIPTHNVNNDTAGRFSNIFQALILTSAPHGLEPNDDVVLSGCNHTLSFEFADGEGGGDVTTINTLNGTQTVTTVYSENCFAVDVFIGSYINAETNFNVHTDDNDYDLSVNIPNHCTPKSVAVDGTIDVTGGASITASFVSLQNSNTGNALDDTAYWSVGGSTTGIQTASTSIVSSVDMFTSDDVGRHIAIVDQSDERRRGSWGSNKTSSPLNAYGTVELKTEGGAWSGLLELQQSTDGINWETIGDIRSVNGEQNGSIEREIIGSKSQIRVRLTDWSNPSGTYETEKCVWQITLTNTIYQTFQITSVTDAKTVEAKPITPLLTSLLTSNWKLGEFSARTGYPRTLAVHNERLIFGGTESKPNTVWASRINAWDDYILDDLSTSPFQFTVASDSYDEIQWLTSAKNLMIGTDNSEVSMGTRNSEQALTATNVDVNSNTYYGSAHIQAIKTADSVFYIDGTKRIVRNTAYDFASDQYQSLNLSEFAEHITKSGIKEMTHSRHPWSTIFFVLENGKACQFTYDRTNEVRGWSQFDTDGTIVSAQANYSQSGDVINAIILRGGAYYLEEFGQKEDDVVYLDNQVQLPVAGGIATNSDYISLADKTLVINDVVLSESDYVEDGDTITITGHSTGTLTIGYPYECIINPTDIVEYGATGEYKRLTKLSMYLLDSGDAQIFVNGKESPFTEALRLESGERINGATDITTGGGYDGAVDVKITTNSHKPLSILGLGYRMTK